MSCGTHSYQNIDQTAIDKMLNALTAKGAVITNDNPWYVDTNNHGVKMTGTWDQANQILEIEITDKDWFVPCGTVWGVIDGLMRQAGAIVVET